MPASKNLIGCVFTYLTVLEKSNKRNSQGSVLWKCICKCNTIVYVPTGSLNNGDNKSCGCRKTEVIREQGLKNTKHGASQTKLRGNSQLDYKIWCSIKERCYNKKSKNYNYYGARGIKIHKSWISDFISFAKYIRTLPNCPSEKMLTSRMKGKRLKISLDRLDNNKNYEPRNLKWATSKEQANNRRSNRVVTYKNKKMTLQQAIDRYAVVSSSTVRNRLRLGWTLSKALRSEAKGVSYED